MSACLRISIGSLWTRVPGRSVSRMTLRQILLTGLEEETKFEKKFSHYVHEESGAVTAFFEDGSSATGDLLVGADGAPIRGSAGSACRHRARRRR